MSLIQSIWRRSAWSWAGRRGESRTILHCAAAGLLLFGGFAAKAAAAVPATPGDRAAVAEVLRQWDSALVGKDLTALLRLYEGSDSLQLARVKNDAGASIGLDTLACTTRLGPLTSWGDTLEAVIFRRLTYREHAREQCELNWNTLRLVRSAGGWKIRADEERTYLRALDTELRVTLLPDSGRMTGEAVIRIEATQPGEDNLLLALNRGERVASDSTASEDSAAAPRDLPFERLADALIVPVPAPLRAGEPRMLRIGFAGALFNEAREAGYSQVGIAPEGCFASWVTDWYPHVRGAGSKSTGRITFNVPAGETVAASGRPAGRTVLGTREEQVFEVRRPVDFSFGVGRYFNKEETVDGVALGVYFLKGGDEKASLYLPALARILRSERGIYGMYPFDSYSIVEIPSEAAGNLGGSSEQGMNLFPVGGLPDDSIPLPLLAHEMGHSWWGNLILAKEGQAINEGMAQMSAVLCIREIEGEEAMRRFLRRGRTGYAQSAKMYFERFAGQEGKDLPLGLPGSGSAERMILHDLADTKGHFVFAMLRDLIGPEAFVQGLRADVSRFAMKEISLRDMQKEWEAASGRDLDVFFRQWFYRSGAPEFSLRYTTEREGGGYEVRGTVVQAGDPYSVRMEITAARRGARASEPVAGSVSPDQRTSAVVEVAGPETSFSFPVKAAPDTVVLDPDYKILRWTDEFRAFALLRRALQLRSAGRADAAVAVLTPPGSPIPGGFAGIYQLGLCYQELGRQAEAEGCFRRVRDEGRLIASDEPAVALSALHLGQLSDLAGRRQEAERWYREVLNAPDEQGSHADAQRGLSAPYVWKAREKGPDPRTLSRLAGDYSVEGGLTVRVALDSDSLLTAQTPGGPSTTLEWMEGLRFRAVLAEGITLQFAEGSPCPALDLDASGRVMHLTRVP